MGRVKLFSLGQCMLCGSSPQVCSILRAQKPYYIKCSSCSAHTEFYDEMMNAVREWNGDFEEITEEGMK